MGAFDDLAAQFDPVNQKRKGDQFEIVCKWFLENDPTYKPLLRRVWMWNDWPGRRDIDAGIDLVAEDHDGKNWAIQAKAYGPDNTITKAHVDKFISESSRAIFTHRLLIGTTDKRHRLAENLMDDLGIPFIGLTRLREADDCLDWPATLGALRPSKPLKPKKPWDYQQAAINDVVKGFKTADRGQLIMACGTGKTLTAWFITEKLAAERTLVLVPSLLLLKQTMREWQTANPTKPFAALPVCSDESVGSLGEDAAVSHTSDLGVPVTTNPKVIAEFLRKRSGPRVVFSTYQSSPQIAAAFALGRVPAFDLVIADEAHRVAGPVSSDFATVLDPAAIKAKRRLFMTATPRYFTGRVLREAKEADYEVASMDDHIKFGEVFHRLSFSDAIERKLLTDYQVAIIGVDDATYRDWAERGTLVTLDGKKLTDARSLAGQIGLAKAIKKFDLRRVISFHSRVKAAKDFAASMPGVLDWMPTQQRPKGTLWSEHASGEMSAGDRHVLIQHLKRLDDGERGLLANARCLSEGVDVPALDGVAFIDPRRSEVDIVQAVGRAIRKSDTKDIGTIVIPVFIDTDEDAEVALDSSVFKPVWDVIKALRAHDTELGEQLDALRREIGREGGTPRLPDKIHIDVPASVSGEFSNAFRTRLVDATTQPWEFWFGILESYVAEHGSARVPKPTSIDGRGLGQWVGAQRTARDRDLLRLDRQHRLESLPGWTWQPFEDAWEKAFALLLDYTASTGTAAVPQKYSIDGFSLGSWTNRHRTLYGAGKLSGDRIERLESLPGWNWEPYDEQWDSTFAYLHRYTETHGSCHLPRDYTVDGVKLWFWASRQRSRHAKGNLSPERQRRLEALEGWTWDPKGKQWESSYELLREYAEKHGSCAVPKNSDGRIDLASWVRGQRTANARGELTTERQRKLESLPNWEWSPYDAQWELGLTALLAYVAEHGDARVPQSYAVGNFRLGVWAHNQRTRRRKGGLAPERQQRLEALPGWEWEPKSSSWDRAFVLLEKYVRENSHAEVPKPYRFEGFDLGGWVSHQRLIVAKGELDDERRQRLGALAGWSWDPLGEQWDHTFRLMREYAEVTTSSRVPKDYLVDGVNLWTWANTQRRFYRTNRLSRERQRLLKSLPDWSWDPKEDAWEKAFLLLQEHSQRHGGVAGASRSESINGVTLSSWIGTQRSRYRNGKLSLERQMRLESLPGWSWDPYGEQWEMAFELLTEYAIEHGSCRVPHKYATNGVDLWTWIVTQRSAHAKGKLDANRADRLASLPGWLWSAS